MDVSSASPELIARRRCQALQDAEQWFKMNPSHRTIPMRPGSTSKRLPVLVPRNKCSPPLKADRHREIFRSLITPVTIITVWRF